MASREVKKIRSKAINSYWDKNCEFIDRCLKGQKLKEAWKRLRAIKSPKKDCSAYFISQREWINYFSDLLREDRPEFTITKTDSGTKIGEINDFEPVSIEELDAAMRGMKNWKAAGPGSIPIELIKNGPQELKRQIANVMNECLRWGKVPEE